MKQVSTEFIINPDPPPLPPQRQHDHINACMAIESGKASRLRYGDAISIPDENSNNLIIVCA